ncbi:hypothetical protein A2631_02255 [Candidatus Daviesbacteria bacterium RIFCSPHIGHO2_01_FULL_44_29]|uniref:Uncharacterized protein n=1 Tax=Candidatus Daviesbacteria bacterium RIFCSPHIGHO2_02_FULL_43_12 TaxID=1797776 RepID=A0A1F5KKA1_9BACT|nr:MAG: hypothetical protein A2631_02255 [Candidatus Daviesbacteria bacterium RIFCSPHIGHO2_01_FULL_44_29]OGE41000.1 MAG: hypothetical protein A3E86_03700 [Candidatus Daviesbacteria bacterium RIFCSPHIGHO2_12_FULL_47_45]OGE41215.1 MAG: hypothetical protein A3D25_01650 [Candidatus Daviesbacteria bacterium RIFCSPHIGHO2_02_FULL_43_12]OGE69415.1 MAG: hypothetical protein A3B55_03390 [Candidatus Daviesbacteria bacterium RIFCSPLOWO2_01_FULL_43_15]
MRTTIIPAQITTVEDKIAGNLNLAQIILLLIPVIWITVVYVLVPTPFAINLYKIPLALVVLIACLILAIRIRGKIVLSWLVVLLQYNLRPRYYVFNKNDTYLREMYMPEIEKRKFQLFNFSFARRQQEKKQIKIAANKFDLKDLVLLKDFLYNPDYSLSLKPDSKGGLYVTLQQIKR